MGGALTGYRLAVLGGDERQVYFIESLLSQGVQAKILGFPGIRALLGSHFSQNIEEALVDVDAIILPMQGVDFNGQIVNLKDMELKLTEEIFRRIPGDVPIYLGVAQPFLRSWAEKYNKKLIEIASLDELAIYNSIPTAEGAIQMAMEQSLITLHGSNCLVLGFGRCGATLARMLSALGAKTTVAARQPRDLARIEEMGLRATNFSSLGMLVAQTDFIFNTVPTKVMNEDVLVQTNKEAIIIDLASAPGGIDFNCATKIGIKALLAPGLPGRVAPKTAGCILGKVLPSYIIRETSLSHRKEAGGQEL